MKPKEKTVAESKVKEALKKAKGNITEAASLLDIRRAEMYRLLKKYSLYPADFKS